MELWEWLGPLVVINVVLVVVSAVLISHYVGKNRHAGNEEGHEPLLVDTLEEGSISEKRSLLGKASSSMPRTESGSRMRSGSEMSDSASSASRSLKQRPSLTIKTDFSGEEGQGSQGNTPDAKEGKQQPAAARSDSLSTSSSSSKSGDPMQRSGSHSRDEGATRAFLSKMADGIPVQLITGDEVVAGASLSIKQGQIMWNTTGSLKKGKWYAPEHKVKGAIRFDDVHSLRSSASSSAERATAKAGLQASDVHPLTILTATKAYDFLLPTRADREQVYEGLASILNLKKTPRASSSSSAKGSAAAGGAPR